MLFYSLYLFRFFNFFFYTISIPNIFTSIHFHHFILCVSKSFTVSSLLLAIFKCFFGFFSSMVNIKLLIIFSLISYKFEFYDKVEYMIFKILQKTLTIGILDIRDEAYDEIMFLFNKERKGNTRNEYYDKKHDVSTLNTIILHIFMFFIWLRLIILLEPLIYAFIYSVLIWLLIVNKWLIMIQVMVIIINISKICFTLHTYSTNILYEYIGRYGDVQNKEKTIKITINNVKIISFIILSLINDITYKCYLASKQEKFATKIYISMYCDYEFVNSLLIDYDVYYKNINKKDIRLRDWPSYEISCKERIITIIKILKLLIGPREREKEKE